MYKIFGHEFSNGDIILALLFALLADRFFKIAEKLSNFAVQLAASRSNEFRRSRIIRLRKKLSAFEAQAQNLSLQLTQQLRLLAECVLFSALSSILIVVNLYGYMSANFLYLFEANHISVSEISGVLLFGFPGLTAEQNSKISLFIFIVTNSLAYYLIRRVLKNIVEIHNYGKPDQAVSVIRENIRVLESKASHYTSTSNS